jgi:hypothetical protein
MIGQKPDLKDAITVRTGVVTASQLARRNSAARGFRKAMNAARAFGVTLGPSVTFDLLLGAAAVGTLTGRLRRHSLTSRERAVRDLTVMGDITLAAYLFAFRPWMQGWGATKDEKRKGLPGDEQVLNPWKSSTRAITVHAPVEKVWPWLAQIGQDRGGFYSYDWLENLAGCHIRNAGTIHTEWQRREIGEVVKLHPEAGCPVMRFEPDRAMVLKGWGAFVVEPMGPGSSRVIIRTRTAGFAPSLFDALLIELPHFMMERRMLKGIKKRAEQSAAASSTSART